MPHQCTSCDRVFPDGSDDVLTGCPDCDGNTFRYLPNRTADPSERPAQQPSPGEAQESKPGPAPTDPPPDGRPSPADPPPDGSDPDSTVSETVDHVTTTLRDFVSSGGSDDGTSRPEGEGAADAALFYGESAEDHAQSSARSDLVTPDELPEEVAGLVRSDPGGRRGEGELLVGGTSGEFVDRDESSDEADAAERDDAPARDETTADPDAAASPTEGSDPGVERAAGGDSAAPTPARGQPGRESAGHGGAGAGTATPDLETIQAELNAQFEGIRVLEPGRYELNPKKLFEREETIIALKEDGRYVIEPPMSWREAG